MYPNPAHVCRRCFTFPHCTERLVFICLSWRAKPCSFAQALYLYILHEKWQAIIHSTLLQEDQVMERIF